MKFIIKFLKNPFTVWLKRTLKNASLEFKNKQLDIGYMSSVSKTRFKKYNTIGNYTSLNKVKIDNFSYIADQTKIFNCEIGKFCSIGSNCKIGLSTHPRHSISSHPFFYKSFKNDLFFIKDFKFNDKSEKIIIGNDVWIGDDVTILGGVKIGDGVIIGTKSLVTKNIEPYSIVAGIPSKLINVRKIKTRNKWWDFSIEELIKLRNSNENEIK